MLDLPITAIVVDENPDDISLAQRTLAANAPNLRVDVARGGREGLALLKQLLGDKAAPSRARQEAARRIFVLLDLDMSHMDGFVFLDTMRREFITAPVPVLLLTSCMQDEPIRRAYQLGAFGYIGKPISLPANLHKLQNYLDLLQIPISLLVSQRHLVGAVG